MTYNTRLSLAQPNSEYWKTVGTEPTISSLGWTYAGNATIYWQQNYGTTLSNFYVAYYVNTSSLSPATDIAKFYITINADVYQINLSTTGTYLQASMIKNGVTLANSLTTSLNRWSGWYFKADGTVEAIYLNSSSNTITAEYFLLNYAVMSISTIYWSGTFAGAEDFYFQIYGESVTAIYNNVVDADTHGGSSSFTSLISSSVLTAMGAGGGGTIITRYEDVAEALANINKSVLIYDDMGKVAFKGEIHQYDRTRDAVTYVADQMSKKLARQLAGVNPVQATGLLYSVVDDEIWDDGSDVFSGLSLAGSFLVITDADLTTVYSLPRTVSYLNIDESAATVTENTDETCARNIEDPHSVMGGPEFYVQYEFYTYLKTGTAINSLGLQMDIRTIQRSLIDITDYPTIWMWNYTTSAWNTFKDFDHNDGTSKSDWDYANSGEPDAAPRVQDTYYSGYGGATGYSADHYLDSDVVIGDYTRYKSKVRIYTGAALGLTNKLEIYMCRLKLVADTDQTLGLGMYKILSNTDSKLVIDNSFGSQLANYPAADGVTAGDSFTVVQSVSDFLSDVFSGGDFTFSHDLTDTRAFAIDATYISKLQVLELLSVLYHARFWHVAGYSSDYLHLKTSFDSTGITLEAEDIINYGHTFTEHTDASDMLDQITLQGALATVSWYDGVDYTIEYAHTLGDTQMSFIDKDVDTQAELDAAESYYTSTRSKLRRTFTFQVKNQSGFELGKTVALQLPSSADPSEVDLTGSDELLIVAISRSKQHNVEAITLTLERIL